MRKRLKFFDSLFMSKGKRILDVGCGTGSFINHCNSSNWDAWGTEIKSIDKNSKILNLDISSETNDLLQKKSFDIVHSSHVLEHVDSPLKFIEASLSYLKPEGYLFIEVPNELSSLTTQIKILLGMQYSSATAFYQHKYFFDINTLKNVILAQNKLKIISASTPFSYYNQNILKKGIDYFQSLLGKGSIITI